MTHPDPSPMASNSRWLQLVMTQLGRLWITFAQHSGAPQFSLRPKYPRDVRVPVPGRLWRPQLLLFTGPTGTTGQFDVGIRRPDRRCRDRWFIAGPATQSQRAHGSDNWPGTEKPHGPFYWVFFGAVVLVPKVRMLWTVLKHHKTVSITTVTTWTWTYQSFMYKFLKYLCTSKSTDVVEACQASFKHH